MFVDYLVLGGSGLVGNGIIEALKQQGFTYSAPDSTSLNLLDVISIDNFLRTTKPKCIIMSAGKVGGIQFNKQNQINQYFANIIMNQNIMLLAAKYNIKNFCLVSSSCIYPLNAPIPLNEKNIFDGLPEFTNEGYAAAKSTALRLLNLYKSHGFEEWFAVVPTNVIGSKNINSMNGHVFDAVISKINDAASKKLTSVSFWGTGEPIRQFIHTSDLGKAIVKLTLKSNLPPIINISNTESLTIKQLIMKVKQAFQYEGVIEFDSSMPNGNMNKTMDSSLLRSLVDWEPEKNIDDSIYEQSLKLLS